MCFFSTDLCQQLSLLNNIDTPTAPQPWALINATPSALPYHPNLPACTYKTQLSHPRELFQDPLPRPALPRQHVYRSRGQADRQSVAAIYTTTTTTTTISHRDSLPRRKIASVHYPRPPVYSIYTYTRTYIHVYVYIHLPVDRLPLSRTRWSVARDARPPTTPIHSPSRRLLFTLSSATNGNIHILLSIFVVNDSSRFFVRPLYVYR